MENQQVSALPFHVHHLEDVNVRSNQKCNNFFDKMAQKIIHNECSDLFVWQPHVEDCFFVLFAISIFLSDPLDRPFHPLPQNCHICLRPISVNNFPVSIVKCSLANQGNGGETGALWTSWHHEHMSLWQSALSNFDNGAL